MSKKMTPNVRFSGFTDDWEQRKLQDIVDVRSGKDYKHLSNGNIPVYGTGGYMLSVNEALSEDDAIGIGRKGTIDKPYILRAPFWTVDTLFYAVPRNQLGLEFLFGMFQRIQWKKLDESTGVPSLSKATINGVIVCSPEIVEQTKIGKLLSMLNDTITHHQKKLENLKLLKKLLLQKLFSQEWRFKGFTEPWEQRKLGECAETFTGGGTPKTNNGLYWNGNLPWIQSSDLTLNSVQTYNVNKKITNLALNESATKAIPAGSIAVVTRVGVGKLALISEDYSTSQDFISLVNITTDKYFLLYVLYRLLSRLSGSSQGTSIKGITKRELINSKVRITNSLTEQRKIGKVLLNSDHLIAHHQKKIDQLKQLKKWLLQNLFM